MLSTIKLTFRANNNVAKSAEIIRKEFGVWLKQELDKQPFPQKIIAKEAKIHPVSLSRIVTGEIGAKRDTVIGIVQAVNNLCFKTGLGVPISLSDALNRYGLVPEPNSPEFNERVKSYAESMLEEMQRSGFDELEDPDVQARVVRNVTRFAEIMIRDELADQNKRQKKTENE